MSIIDDVHVLLALYSGGGANLLEELIFSCLDLTALLSLMPVHCRFYT